MKKFFFILVILSIILTGCKEEKRQGRTQKQGDEKMTLTVTSSAFAEGNMIPSKYSCDG